MQNMPHRIHREIDNIKSTSGFLCSILAANKEEICDNLQLIHEHDCRLYSCPVKSFARKYERELKSVVEKLNGLFAEYESVHQSYLITKSLDNIYSKKNNHESSNPFYPSKNRTPLYTVEMHQISQNENVSTTNQATNQTAENIEFSEGSKQVSTDNLPKYSNLGPPSNNRTPLYTAEMHRSENVSTTMPCTSKQATSADNLESDNKDSHNSLLQEDSDDGHEKMNIFTSSQADMEEIDCQQDLNNNIIKSNSEKTLSGFSEKTVTGAPSAIGKADEEMNKTLEGDSIQVVEQVTATQLNAIPDESLINSQGKKSYASRRHLDELRKTPEVDFNYSELGYIRSNESSPNSFNTDALMDESQKIHLGYKLTNATAYKCFVTYVVSPLLFWIQLYESKDLDKELTVKLSEFYNNPENSSRSRLRIVNENCYYAAQFSNDRCWYRARVLAFDKQKGLATVFYIDYGNTEILPVDSLRQLASQFCSIKRLAVPLSLANIAPSSEDKVWKQQELEEFKSVALNRSGEIYVKSNENWPILFCKLDVRRKVKKTTIEVVNYLTDLVSEKPLYRHVKQNLITSEYRDLFDQDVSSQMIPNLQVLVRNDRPIAKASGSKSHVAAGSVISDSLVSESPEQHLKKMQLNCSGVHSLENYAFSTDELDKNMIEIDDDSHFNFQLFCITDPSEFYIKHSFENEPYLNMENNLNYHYKLNEGKLTDVSRRIKKYLDNMLCVVQCSNYFYRALISSQGHNQTHVTLIDYGVKVSVESDKVYPLLKDFCSPPPMCVKCCLMHIKPNTTSNAWSQSAIDYFKKKIEKKTTYEAKVLSKSRLVECELTKPLELFVFIDSAREMCLNYELIYKRLAKVLHKPNNETLLEADNNIKKEPELPGNLIGDRSIMPYNSLSPEDEQERKERLESYILNQANFVENMKEGEANMDMDLDNWNPCKEHYNSIRNAYGFNQDSYETHVFGYELIYSSKVKETKPIFGDVFSKPKQFFLDDWLILELVSFKENFQATLRGYFDQETFQYVDCNNLDQLTEAMKKYYGKKRFLEEKTTFYVRGQIVAAKSLKDKGENWYRASVYEIESTDNIDNTQITVLYIDYGHKEKLPIHRLYPINKRFLNYPEQRIQFEMADVKLLGSKKKFKRAFNEIINGNTCIIACVKKVDFCGLMSLYLFQRTTNKAEPLIDLNQLVLSRGLAEPSNKITRSP